MDPTSLIGTAAAAVQLAGLCKNLASLFKTAKLTLENYVKSIEELLVVSNLIIRKPPLHTHEITTLVNSIIELLDSLRIPPRASKNRLTAFWTLLWKGGELSDVFLKLETKKSTILLCIAGVQSSILQDIRDDIANMSSQIQDHSVVEEAGPTTAPTPAHHAAETSSPGLPPTANEGRNRDPEPKPSDKVVESEEQATSGNAAAENANVFAEYVEMDSSEAKAMQVCGFANGRSAGDKERMFIRKAIMKGKGQMVIGFSN